MRESATNETAPSVATTAVDLFTETLRPATFRLTSLDLQLPPGESLRVPSAAFAGSAVPFPQPYLCWQPSHCSCFVGTTGHSPSSSRSRNSEAFRRGQFCIICWSELLFCSRRMATLNQKLCRSRTGRKGNVSDRRRDRRLLREGHPSSELKQFPYPDLSVRFASSLSSFKTRKISHRNRGPDGNLGETSDV
jgi:hypothetical protein